MIEVSDLVKRYGSHTVLDHLSFTVNDGQIYGFLGPNGAGKTTTMNILTGYIGMTEGSVTINGHDLLEEPDAVRRSIGYLPEQPPLYVDMTPLEYLTFAAELKKLPRTERADAVDEVMELTQLTSMRNRLIRNLSKGYRQRVGLAQAILGFPEIIILDEPTVGLDPRQIIEIRSLIRSLADRHTVILSSHILSEVQEVCDHILMLHHGKLVADGTPEELERSLRDNALELTLKSSGEAAVRDLLAAVEGVSRTEIVPVADGFRAVVFAEGDADLREAVFRACAAADLPLLGMRFRTTGLEQVFLKLVNDEELSAQEETISPSPDEGPEDLPEPDDRSGSDEGSERDEASVPDDPDSGEKEEAET